MVALPHKDNEPCQCLRCQSRIVVTYSTTVNGQQVGVIAEIGTAGCDFLVDILQGAINAALEINAPAVAIAQAEHLQAIFRRQVPAIVPTAKHGGQANDQG